MIAPNLIYVLEDNEWYNKLLVHNLSLNPELEIKSFYTAADFFDSFSMQPPAIVTLDYRLPDTNGDEVLKKIKVQSAQTEVLVISEQEDISTAVNLLKSGAHDYMVKSNEIKDVLHHTINRILKNNKLKDDITILKEEVQKKYDFSDVIIGESDQIKNIYGLINKALNVNINVSISGETGTGKEVVAKAIHYNSNRKGKSFVAVNMAAIPSELIESELFGHEKGAFTGASSRRKGKFEEAHQGTIFLDEIGEMNIDLQAKILRVLQEQEITRVGGNTPIKIDARIIVATNKNLEELVKKNRFREDLYYRILGLPIHLPPLRERGNDVLILSKYFLKLFCKENNLPNITLSDEAKEKLLSYNWPGNIRELKSVIELAAVMSDETTIEGADITITKSEGIIPNDLSQEMTLRAYNRKIITFYMKKYDSDTKKVAEKLDIGQTTVYRLLKEIKEFDTV